MYKASTTLSAKLFLLFLIIACSALGSPGWSAETFRVTDDPAPSTDPYVCSLHNGSGDISIVWIDGRSGADAVYLTRVNPAGQKILQDTQISGAVSAASLPSCGVDTAGNSHIVWKEAESLMYGKFSPSGVILVSPFARIAPPVDQPHIGVEPGGRVHIVWVDASTSLREGKYRRLDASGQLTGCTVQTLMDFPSGPISAEYPFVLANGTGNAYPFISWHGTNAAPTHYMNISLAFSCTDLGGPFQQTNDLVVGRSAMTPDFGGDENAHLVFEGVPEPGSSHIYWFSDFPTYTAIDQASGPATHPSIASLDNASSLAVWQDSRSGAPQVYGQCIDDVARQLPGNNILLSNGVSTAQHPSATRAGADGFAIAWQDGRHGPDEIYLAIRNFECPDETVCDGLDDGGNGSIDEGCDDDGDGYCDISMIIVGNPSICPSGGGDCQDNQPDIYPAAPEQCDSVDNQCPGDSGFGLVDERCDDDGDDYCDLAMTTVEFPSVCPNGGGDCNDTPGAGADVNPGRMEVCNLVDDNCTLGVDEGFDLDVDGDQEMACTDCDDNDGERSNAFTEIPGNGIDDDCDADTPDSGANSIASHVAFGPNSEFRVAQAQVRLELKIDPGVWLIVRVAAVNPGDGSFVFSSLIDGTYRATATINWIDRVRTPMGDVLDNRSVERTSGEVSVVNGVAESASPILFPFPVVLVYGQGGGACLPMTVDGQSIECAPARHSCSDLTDYWSAALPVFLEDGFMTFIADGLAACNAPAGSGSLHEYNGERLGDYLDYVHSRLNPRVVGDKIAVDLVAHSMGGITSRAYLASNPGKPISVRRLVMLGTPNAGSITAERAFNFKAANFLTREALRIFNDEYGDPDDRAHVPFYSIMGSGGNTSPDIGLFVSSDLEPLPNDGPVSRQSAVPYDVPDDTVLFSGRVNSDFRMEDNCFPDGAPNNCLIRIPSEEYLCTQDDHFQLITAPGTIGLAELLLVDQTEPGGLVDIFRCTDQPGMQSTAISSNAEAAVVGSRITRISVGSMFPSGVIAHGHLIDNTPETAFSVEWDSGSMSFTLEDPLGATVDPAVALVDPNIDYSDSTSSVAGSIALYRIQNPASGTWSLNLTAGPDGTPEGINYVATTTAESDVSIGVGVSPGILELGQTAVIEVTADEQGTHLLGGLVAATARDRDGVAAELACSDDGLAPDTSLNDGVFTCSYGPLGVSGIHSISIVSSGARMDATPFERNEIATLSVHASGATLAGTYSESTSDDEPDGLFNSLIIDVDVNVTTQAIYDLGAQLEDGSNQLIASAHLQGQDLAVGSHTLALDFDGTTIRNHGVNGQYVVASVTLRRADRDLVPVDGATNAYTTAAYDAAEFQLDDPDGDGIASNDDLCPTVNDPSQTDTDGDLVGDACDNCRLNVNASQADTDGDGFGNVCDLCPTTVDSIQGDIDEDLVGDTCDPDIDGDGVANGSDCNVLDNALWSFAPEVVDLVLTETGTLSWTVVTTADGASITYDVVKGDLSHLIDTGAFDNTICQADALILAEATDLFDPLVGQTFYYLVRSVTPCSEGDYGSGGAAVRTIVSCP